MKMRLDEETIALRAAKEFEDGMVVNLGYGMPGLCANFIPEERTVFFQAENGILGYGPLLTDEEKDYELINASDQPVTALPGMCFFDSATSFDMIRGGHIDVVILGAYQVSEKGDLANWGRPGRPATGMGGGMDLALGGKKLMVMMLHTTKEGGPRIVRQCTFPLTARNCVKKIFTDIAVIDVTKQGLVLREVAPAWTAEEVQALTEARLIVGEDLKEIEL
ncbi:MAG: butyryl-CoA:acetate CoA transferase [Deltaproteobacteria bacterium]|jgi:3-oxoacid CoA-transferase B subunit|nr:butyryl-CoA:acetate CoA transferase [Deltaproteobacteria bacterium]